LGLVPERLGVLEGLERLAKAREGKEHSSAPVLDAPEVVLLEHPAADPLGEPPDGLVAAIVGHGRVAQDELTPPGPVSLSNLLVDLRRELEAVQEQLDFIGDWI